MFQYLLKDKPKIKAEHPRLKVLELGEDNIRILQELTAHQDVAAVKAILIDQEGFAMMAYDNHHSGNQLLKDIKRLLKYSYEKLERVICIGKLISGLAMDGVLGWQ